MPANPGPGSTPPTHSWIYRRAILPILALLRMGASPERLAWSIAAGLLIGINPVLGSTTILCLLAALAFRLSVPASQLANHLMYPLEIILLIPFFKLGSSLFQTAPMPLSPTVLLQQARTSPIALSRALWTWQWHALVVWIVLATVAIPAIALTLTPLLRRLLVRIDRHQYPILPAIEP